MSSTDPDLYNALYSDYYGGCVGKGGVVIQLCGRIGTCVALCINLHQRMRIRIMMKGMVLQILILTTIQKTIVTGSWFIKKGASLSHIDYSTIDDIWMGWGFRVNFMYSPVH